MVQQVQNSEICLIYDGTFEGFLTTIFEIYNRKITPIDIICKRERQIYLFSEELVIVTDDKQSDRVWNGIKRIVARDGMLMIYHAFLSQENQIELKLYHLIMEIFKTKQDATCNMSNMNTFDILQAKRRVTKEAQRMLMFVRFQRTADDLYFSVIDPMYDVLP